MTNRLTLVASDIDGTLTDSTGEIPPFTVEVLRALLDGGTPVVLVTGLNPWPARRHVERIEHGVRAIALNGVFLLEDGELHAGQFLDAEVIREAVEGMIDQGFVPLVYGKDGTSRYLPNTESVAHVQRLIEERPYQPFEAVDSVEALFDVRPAQVSTCDDLERTGMLFPRLKEALGERAYVVHQPSARMGSWVEVNHPRARKDVALLDLAQRLGVAPEELIYFGDSLNDLPVFEAIPHAVAVANARPEIKEVAWRVIDSNNEEGVAHFLAAWFHLQVGRP